MHHQEWMTLVACGASITLAVLIIWFGRGTPLALPLVLLTIDCCVFNVATVIFELSKGRLRAFDLVDKSTSPFAIALTLHFVLAFVGRRQAFRWVLALSYVVAALIALVAPLSLLYPWAAKLIYHRSQLDRIDLTGWEMAMLGHLGAAMAFGMPLLVQHYRRSRRGVERARTRVVITAIAVLAIAAGSELLPDVNGAAPIAQAMFTLLLAAITLRLGLFEHERTSIVLLIAATAGFVVVCDILWLFTAEDQLPPLVVLMVVLVTLIFLTIRGFLDRFELSQVRLQRLATAGKLSDQLAHNLKNPLAALKGAAQFLKEELSQGRSVDDQQELIDLLLAQVRRLEAGLDEYQRLGKVEPVFRSCQVNDVVRNVLAQQKLIEPGKVRVREDIDEELPTCQADPRLLEQALENLVRNSFEALVDGGDLTVATRRGLGELIVAVSDTGCGMNGRTVERALREFYTTKPAGSGLGLAYARRVAVAHGGRLIIESREGHGTTVRLSLPV